MYIYTQCEFWPCVRKKKVRYIFYQVTRVKEIIPKIEPPQCTCTNFFYFLTTPHPTPPLLISMSVNPLRRGEEEEEAVYKAKWSANISVQRIPSAPTKEASCDSVHTTSFEKAYIFL